MNREGKKYFSYVRVSTEMQVDGYSLEGQENSIKRFAEREEMICAGIYKDAGKSGKSIEGRPDFKRLLLDIQNGAKVDFVIVYKLSRFGRNAADILNSLELIQSYGVELICVEEGIDSSQTSGKLLISVLSAVAEIERENILEQTMNGRREKARQGLWNGGPAPYGYVLKENRLIVSEEEAKIVQMIFDKYVNTKIGYNGIARLYCNRHAWTNKDGTYKDVYYYYCGHSDSSRGKVCNYKAKLKKCDIEPLVIEVIKEIVGNEFFVTEIQKRIGKQTDSSVIDRELKNYQQKLKEVEANKFRLEQEIDNMPLDAKYRERKIQDMTTRLESLYETMMDLEGLIKDAQLRKNAIEEDVMTMENIYRLLLSFSQIYDKMDDIEKKNLLSYLIKRIDIYANDEGTTQVLKSIEFNFPIYKDGTFVRKILLDERVNVETLVLLSKKD